MKSFAAAAVTALALASRVGADANTVYADIQLLGTSLQALDADVKTLVPGITGLPTALLVQADAVSVDKVLIQSINDANASPAFGEPSSFNISFELLALEPTVTTTLNDVAAKNATFDYLAPIVLASLYQLKQDTDTFAAALIKKLSPLEAAIAPAVVSSIDSSFNSAIVAYGGKAS